MLFVSFVLDTQMKYVEVSTKPARAASWMLVGDFQEAHDTPRQSQCVCVHLMVFCLFVCFLFCFLIESFNNMSTLCLLLGRLTSSKAILHLFCLTPPPSPFICLRNNPTLPHITTLLYHSSITHIIINYRLQVSMATFKK